MSKKQTKAEIVASRAPAPAEEAPIAQIVIMDIDGTLANADHRVHLIRGHEGDVEKAPDWPAFLAAAINDPPNPEIVTLSNAMAEHALIFVVTGRNENTRDSTIAWLEKHRIHFDRLYMRGENDRRPDTAVKADILSVIQGEGFKILFAVEDRKSVTAMWRANDIRCLQVCEGDY